MGNVFLHGKGGASGGGSGAGLTIVGGTTRPAKATQNMIWVNTDVEITSYVLSATEPENPVEGMAWIAIGNSGITKLASPVGDEWITVYPLSAKQYVGGAWVDKESKSYQYGEWVDWWDGTLFDNGNQYTDITGGWWQNPNLGWTSSYAPNTGTVTISDSLNLNAPANNGAGVSTKKPVDLTHYNIIKANISSNSHEVGLVVHDNLNNGLHTSQLADVNMKGTGEFSLDVSAIKGSHYITLMNYNGGKADITKVWLER